MILTISIPSDGKCLLKPGQIVDFDTDFLENKLNSEITINVSKKLGIASDKIFNYLKKFVGDPIKRGEIIAEKKGLISNLTVESNYTGFIKEINHYDGNVIISSSGGQQTNKIKAFFKGEVVDLNKNQLKIKVGHLQEFNIKLVTDNFGGQTFYLKDATKPIFSLQTSNKIMVIESITAYLKTKAEALGIKGFVTLKTPPQESNLPKAQIKNIEDFKKVLHLNFPYCLVDKQYSKIYFYR